jgi:hypothetical protein
MQGGGGTKDVGGKTAPHLKCAMEKVHGNGIMGLSIALTSVIM